MILPSLIWMAVPVLAQADPASEAPRFDSGADLIRMLVQTAFVLGFVCALAYLVIRVIPRRTGLVSDGSMLRIVDRVPLDQRKNLYIVTAAGRWLVIASSEAGVQLISELDAEAAESEAALAREHSTLRGVGARARTAFADRLSEMMKKKR